MNVMASLAIGVAPAVLGVVAISLHPSGDALVLPIYLLAVGCSFRGGFGVADWLNKSPGKNLLLGFGLSAVFLVLNIGAFVATAVRKD